MKTIFCKGKKQGQILNNKVPFVLLQVQRTRFFGTDVTESESKNVLVSCYKRGQTPLNLPPTITVLEDVILIKVNEYQTMTIDHVEKELFCVMSVTSWDSCTFSIQFA